MTGRHAAGDAIDDEALAAGPQEPGSHRADVDPQGAIGDGTVPADADLQAEPTPAQVSAPASGRRSRTAANTTRETP